MATAIRRACVIWLTVILVGTGTAGLVHAQQQPQRSSSASTPAAAASAGRSCATAPRLKVPDRPRFGLSLSTVGLSFRDAIAQQRRNFGNLPALRVFDSGIPPENAWSRRRPELTKHTQVVTSFRMPPAQVIAGQYDAQLTHFFKTAPSHHRVFYSYYHEPEPLIAAGVFSAAQYRQAWRHIATLAASTCKKNLYPTLILTGYTSCSCSRRNIGDYYPGKKYISVMAWDPYNSVNSRPTSYAPPKYIFGDAVKVAKRFHKPWGVAETGSALTASDPTGAQRAKWLTKVGRFTTKHHAAFVTYFDSTVGQDFRLLDQPSIRAWRALMHPKSR